MNNAKEINALIRLLADPTEDIYQHVRQKIIDLGTDAISLLQMANESATDELMKKRVNELLTSLKLDRLKTEMLDWRLTQKHDLLEGLVRIARFGTPDIPVGEIRTFLDEVTAAVKSKLKSDDPKDVIKVMNQVILQQYGFKGNADDYSSTNNSLINKAIGFRLGNPIMLSIIYLLVAKNLDIPLLGINSPRHFILAYAIAPYDPLNASQQSLDERVDLYIDPFYGGRIYDHGFFDQMLLSADFDLIHKSELIADNVDIIARVMNNLIYGLHVSGHRETAQLLIPLVDQLQHR